MAIRPCEPVNHVHPFETRLERVPSRAQTNATRDSSRAPGRIEFPSMGFTWATRQPSRMARSGSVGLSETAAEPWPGLGPPVGGSCLPMSAFTFTLLAMELVILLALLGAYPTYLVIRNILKERYFASEEFLAHKADVAAMVAEHNEVTDYTAEIRASGSFQLGASATGRQAGLASFENTSNWNYRRDRNVADYAAPNVHNCSLQVVRNASADPLKYLMKYFNIKATEDNLTDVEKLGESISSLENAVSNLASREEEIAASINPPPFILKHYLYEFMERAGVELSPISVPYPVYSFEYVSAGGNSSQRATITLDTRTIDALVETLSTKIRWRKSAAGQRALMTARLRTHIKSRDNYTCQQCSISVHDEPHLLLEVDHIIPISKGGLSTEENLQTLCWRCNRTKSNKLPA